MKHGNTNKSQEKSMGGIQDDRRAFCRFAISLEIKVTVQDVHGGQYNEETILEDISGGGAKFTTFQATKYYVGQSVDMTISLPGSQEVKACMKGKATVVRIDGTKDPLGKERGARIAVKFDNPLYLERFV